MVGGCEPPSSTRTSGASMPAKPATTTSGGVRTDGTMRPIACPDHTATTRKSDVTTTVGSAGTARYAS